MEIIEEGELPEEKVYRARCGNCKSLIQARLKELNSSFSQRDDNSWLSGECPFCKKDITTWKEHNEQ